MKLDLIVENEEPEIRVEVEAGMEGEEEEKEGCEELKEEGGEERGGQMELKIEMHQK